MPIEKIREHKLIINSREQININAVKRIEYLSPEAVLASTDMGRLAIRGDGLHVENLSSESGELIIKGKINSIAYLEKDGETKWLKRIFR